MSYILIIMVISAPLNANIHDGLYLFNKERYCKAAIDGLQRQATHEHWTILTGCYPAKEPKL